MSSTPAAAGAASSSSTSARGFTKKQKKEKTKRAGSGLDPRLVAHCRQGYTRLINIREFATRYSELQARLTRVCSEELVVDESQLPDLSVDDIAIPTPFQAIEKAIEEEVVRVHAEQRGMEQYVHYRMRQKFHQVSFPGMGGGDPAGEGTSTDQSHQLQTSGMSDEHEMEEHKSDLHLQHMQHQHDQMNLDMDEHHSQQQQQQSHESSSQAAAAAANNTAASPSMALPARVPTPNMSPEFREILELHLNSLSASPQPNFTLYSNLQKLASEYLPPDLGHKIPKYEDLVGPLQPLQQQRLNLKRHREPNCVTPQTFEYDVQSRTHSQPPQPLSPNEVILRVAVYHPTNFSKSQEFLVCGSQPLTSLRDRIYCLHDHTLDGPSTPSGFFFIENKFYNDLRDRRAISYSEPILNWIRSDSRYTHPGLAHFDECDMAATTFNSLSIRLGSHYFYQHQGDCVHTLIFTQIRMAHPHDIPNLLAYPLIPFQSKTHRRKCRVCNIHPAAYVTYGDKLANENPFFYCEECYRPLHYTCEGNLLYGDFQVYPYDHE